MESSADQNRVRVLSTQIAKQELALAQAGLELTRTLLDSPDDHDRDSEYLLQMCHRAAEFALRGFLRFWGETENWGASIELTGLLDHASRVEPVFITWWDEAERLSAGAVSYAQAIDEAWEDAEVIVRQAVAFCTSDSIDGSFDG